MVLSWYYHDLSPQKRERMGYTVDPQIESAERSVNTKREQLGLFVGPSTMSRNWSSTHLQLFNSMRAPFCPLSASLADPLQVSAPAEAHRVRVKKGKAVFCDFTSNNLYSRRLSGMSNLFYLK